MRTHKLTHSLTAYQTSALETRADTATEKKHINRAGDRKMQCSGVQTRDLFRYSSPRCVVPPYRPFYPALFRRLLTLWFYDHGQISQFVMVVELCCCCCRCRWLPQREHGRPRYPSMLRVMCKFFQWPLPPAAPLVSREETRRPCWKWAQMSCPPSNVSNVHTQGNAGRRGKKNRLAFSLAVFG